ncbi:enoyl-CoA hydratase [Blastococcus sp. MG754426]|uniref:enoyl-CoA hydratase-related protein n=1 Tax=unclassified Blastococcus TaxID=2619396 RepID=UPI001EF0A356|nr:MULTISPECIES: enoyl-CoA hydratase-related protein [unclassified Blastococcus]MCF6506404.1 enoyl-CoA hydratase [Blastococcus sp. MG754426]MCF6513067.1 enoyl-CoA hydratase [Blastococcus sp. MG754427]
MADQELVHVDHRGPAAVVTLDSPHNRNALSAALLEQLHSALRQTMGQPAVRVLVLTGAGPVFCSGADLKEQRTGVRPGGNLPEVLTLIMEGPKPVVARVNGAARAGGLGLVAACDLAVGLAGATFGFSEVRIGVAPAIIAVPVLRRMDRRAARELFLTGEQFDGVRAREAGLLDRAVADDELDETVDSLVGQLSRGAPEALAITKQLLRDIPGADLQEDLRRMAEVSAERFLSAEAREGIAALLDKRLPAWVSPAGAPTGGGAA